MIHFKRKRFGHLSKTICALFWTIPALATETQSRFLHLALSPSEATRLKIQEPYELSNVFSDLKVRGNDIFLDVMRLVDVVLISLFIADSKSSWGKTAAKSSFLLLQSLAIGEFDFSQSYFTKKIRRKTHPIFSLVQKHADSACRFYGAKSAHSVIHSYVVRENLNQLDSGAKFLLDGSEVQDTSSSPYLFRFDSGSVKCKLSIGKTRTLRELEISQSVNKAR